MCALMPVRNSPFGHWSTVQIKILMVKFAFPTWVLEIVSSIKEASRKTFHVKEIAG
jgi:hypothetical protein